MSLGNTRNSATSSSGATGAAGGRLSLLVVGESSSSSHWLPPSGTVIIGRGQDCDIRLVDESVSRQHAALHLDGRPEIEELGSANGTWVGGRRLAPRQRSAIEVGEPVSLGRVHLVLQRQSLTSERRLWSHGYFESRLEEECLRAERAKTSLALLRVHAPSVASEVLENTLASVVRLVDLIGVYAPGEYELLLPDTQPSGAELVRARLLDRLGPQAAARIGLACFPSDSRNPHGLIAMADTMVHGDSRAPSTSSAAGAMERLGEIVERVAASDIAVLILGETGAGKERLAERIHSGSKRAPKPFLRLNCAAFTESLLESELFGHERGAFTGAQEAKQGLLETAAGGTVFLDEVGELPLQLQAKLLRVIEDHKVMRVGGLKPRPLDVRFVSATNRDLEAEVARKAFREDLFFRLNGVMLIVPPLRERVDEVAGLATSFITDACARLQRAPVPKLSADALAALKRYRWPGNIRELRNVIERAVLLSSGPQIELSHLPEDKMSATFAVRQQSEAPAQQNTRVSHALYPEALGQPPRTPAAAPAPEARPADEAERKPAGRRGSKLLSPELKQAIAAHEKEEISRALAKVGGNQTEAAKLLKVSRRTLIERIKAYGLPQPRKARARQA